MPDLATAPPHLAPATPPPTPQAPGLQGDADAMGAALQRVEQGARDTQGKIEGAVGSLQPPKLEIPPPPVVQPTDPMRVWSSSALTFAVLGSLLTRRPLTTAMNAAAQVIQSFRKGDEAAAQAAYHTWEVSTKNAIALADFQNTQYKAILDRASHLETMNAENASRTERAIIAEFDAHAHAFQDETARMTAEREGIQGAERLIMERQRLAMAMQEQGPKLEQELLVLQATKKMMASPEFQQATPLDQARMIMGLRSNHAPLLDTRGDHSQSDMKMAESIFNAEFPKQGGLGGRAAGAPEFEQWYRDVWPTWGNQPIQSGHAGGQHFNGKLPPQAAGALQFFDQTWPNHVASAIVSGLVAESGLQANPPGPNDGGQAYGVAQWHGPRQAAYEAWAKQNGKPALRSSSLQDQMEFVNYELTRGQYHWMENLLKHTTTAQQANDMLTHLYFAPANWEAKAQQRAGITAAVAGQSAPPPVQGAGGGVAVPSGLAHDPDGTTYQKDGKTWVKRGNMIFPQG